MPGQVSLPYRVGAAQSWLVWTSLWFLLPMMGVVMALG